MKYKAVYDVLNERRQTTPGFCYHDRSGWRAYPQTYPDTVLPRVRPAHQRAHRIQFVFGNCPLLYLAAVSHPASRL